MQVCAFFGGDSDPFCISATNTGGGYDIYRKRNGLLDFGCREANCGNSSIECKGKIVDAFVEILDNKDIAVLKYRSWYITKGKVCGEFVRMGIANSSGVCNCWQRS